jgi:hypothetical protein
MHNFRKFKSENNVSIKFPVKLIKLTSYLKPIEADFKAVTSCAEIIWDDNYPSPEVQLGEAEAA